MLAAVLAAGGLAFVALRFAWRRLAAAATDTAERRVLAVFAGTLAAAWLAGLAGHAPAPGWLRFSLPVSATVADQLRLVARAFAEARVAPGSGDAAAPSAPPSFEALAGDDVLLVFVESYGSVTLSEPALAARLAAGREGLARAVAAAGGRAVSATVLAPTFGGNSWLSHLRGDRCGRRAWRVREAPETAAA